MEIKAKEITLFPSVKLSEYPKNVNVHTEEQIDKIIQLIDFYGHRDPLIVDADIQPDGTHWVLAGNGRLQASKKAGWDNLPIIFQKFNSEEEKYGFMVSHNAVSSSGWGGGLDLAKINTGIIDLGPDFDIDLLGIKDFTIEPIEKYESTNEENGKGALDKLEKYLDKEFLEVKLEFGKREYDDFIYLASEVMKEMNSEIMSDALLGFLRKWKS